MDWTKLRTYTSLIAKRANLSWHAWVLNKNGRNADKNIRRCDIIANEIILFVFPSQSFVVHRRDSEEFVDYIQLSCMRWYHVSSMFIIYKQFVSLENLTIQSIKKMNINFV